MAIQWTDIFESHAPSFMKDLPCDHWQVEEGPELGTKAILCIDCSWYRIIPIDGVAAARGLREAIDKLFRGEDA